MSARNVPSGSRQAATVEQALGAFGLLRDFFQGAIIVDQQSRITWIDQRYRELLQLGPDFDPLGVPIHPPPDVLHAAVVAPGPTRDAFEVTSRAVQ
jgi:hypothetical protein